MAEPMTRLRLRVSPGSRQGEIAGRYADGWKVRVTSAPERGRANAALLRLLSGVLGLPAGKLSVVSGHASRDKVVELRGLEASEAARRLDATS